MKVYRTSLPAFFRPYCHWNWNGVMERGAYRKNGDSDEALGVLNDCDWVAIAKARNPY